MVARRVARRTAAGAGGRTSGRRSSPTRIGRHGEQIAARYLELSGFEIIGRNVRLQRDEIDLVALRSGLVCFVEVRLRRASGFGAAAETVGWEKRRRLRRAAALYLDGRRRGGHRASHCRFDVIAIELRPGIGLELEHLADAFR